MRRNQFGLYRNSRRSFPKSRYSKFWSIGRYFTKILVSQDTKSPYFIVIGANVK